MMAATSDSEGEFLESRGAPKVPQTRITSKSNSVDRTSRHSPASHSSHSDTAPTMQFQDRDQYGSDRFGLNYAGGRRPHNGNNGNNRGRGGHGNRGRNDDRQDRAPYDGRSVRRYGDIDTNDTSRHNDNNGRYEWDRKSKSRHDSDRYNNSRYDSDRGREHERDNKRQRTSYRTEDRSRSPWHPGKGGRDIRDREDTTRRPYDQGTASRNSTYDHRNVDGRNDINNANSDRLNSQQQSVDNRNQTMRGNKQIMRNAKENNTVRQQNPAYNTNGSVTANLSTQSTPTVNIPDAQPPSAAQPVTQGEPVVDEAAPEPQKDEATLIEERRQRRKALAERLARESKDSYASALLNEMNATPSTSRDATPRRTPMQTSTPGSPAEIAFPVGNDLVNHVQGDPMDQDDNGPLAADYDPMQDGQDDRVRNMSTNGGMAAADYDETTQGPDRVLVPASNVQPAPAHAADDDDDYDMFAEELDDKVLQPKATAPTVQEGSQAVSVAQTRAPEGGMIETDDTEGYYIVTIGSLLGGRYRVLEKLGKGMFANVVRALHLETKEVVAIKIIRNNETMRKAGMKEIEILQKLNEKDPEDRKHVVRLLRHFEHRGHLCMVFENLGQNLREVIKSYGRNAGLNLQACIAYAHQMFLALSLLAKANIIHADLKPDNILKSYTSDSMIKVCDLGSAAENSERNELTAYLASRFYRAPEVILGMDYGLPIDIWSVGCTLFELYTSKILFAGSSNNQMLRVIQDCLGGITIKQLKKAEYAGKHFDDKGNFVSHETDFTGKQVLRVMVMPKNPAKDLKARVKEAARLYHEPNMKALDLFIDLLEKCLRVKPDTRIDALKALQHPVFKYKF